MDEMVAADGRGVAVAHGHEDVELGAGQLQARGEAEGAAVQGVHGVEVHVAGDAGGAADAGHEADLLLRDAEVVDGVEQAVEDDAVSAARAPDVGEEALADKILDAH